MFVFVERLQRRPFFSVWLHDKCIDGLVTKSSRIHNSQEKVS